ncbi:MAG: hypothetical protein AAFR53_06240 [Pseudomonadota bacterium]
MSDLDSFVAQLSAAKTEIDAKLATADLLKYVEAQLQKTGFDAEITVGRKGISLTWFPSTYRPAAPQNPDKGG